MVRCGDPDAIDSIVPMPTQPGARLILKKTHGAWWCSRTAATTTSGGYRHSRKEDRHVIASIHRRLRPKFESSRYPLFIMTASRFKTCLKKISVTSELARSQVLREAFFARRSISHYGSDVTLYEIASPPTSAARNDETSVFNSAAEMPRYFILPFDLERIEIPRHKHYGKIACASLTHPFRVATEIE